MDPILLSIATAAASTAGGKAVEGVIAAGRYVKERFAKDRDRKLTLMEARDEEIPMTDLAKAIEEECAADPAFRGELERLAGRSIQVTQVNQAGQQVKFQNNFYGPGPEKVVQGETINIQNLN
ncbi:hypothetical protein [Glycomyces sp. NPDC047010]|uniref:hypothetical protein n=1 Tax=Glycomyces sp. NPDC047010 TaxID=3155023 RepID=UPI003401266E